MKFELLKISQNGSLFIIIICSTKKKVSVCERERDEEMKSAS